MCSPGSAEAVTVLVVTGTDTGVGKTVATAALACHARQAGIDVAVCKPVQTGTDDGDDDLAEVGPAVRGDRAGRAGRMALPSREQLLGFIGELDRPGRLTLVEGAGGLLVELGENGVTARDLAVALGAAVLVVVRPALGTLNHTALTLEALAAQGLSCAGLVIGAWPEHPGPVETSNRPALEALAPVPAGAAALAAAEFEAVSAGAFDRDWVTALAG